MALQHLRSSTANKRPTPAAMSDGQLAMNTNLASPGLFLKDSNGDLVKVGPVHVGTTAPNASPAIGGQTGNSLGEQWLDTSSGRYVFKIWDGTAWRTEDGEFVNSSGDTMTGALGIIAGTAAAPGVFFSGDTNTGLYSPGADQVAISTNGTGRLFVDASGNVGLGTSSPQDLFHVEGATSPTIRLRNSTTGSNASPASTFIDFRGFNQEIRARIEAQDRRTNLNGGFLNIGTADVTNTLVNALHIDSSQRVGIGTSSPTQTLHVENGNLINASLTFGASAIQTIRGSFGGSGIREIAIGVTGDSPNNPYLQSRNNSNTAQALLLNPAGGAVGIGTTTPQGTFVASKAGAEGIELLPGSASNVNVTQHYNRSGSAWCESRNDASFHSWYIQGNQKAQIDTSGRLLVGTSTGTNNLRLDQKFAVVSTGSAPYGGASFTTYASTGGAAGPRTVIDLQRSRGATDGSFTAVANNDELGSIIWRGADGSQFLDAANISASVDGTPGANDMPSRLVFSTTADGASSPTERMRIHAGGAVTFAKTNITTANNGFWIEPTGGIFATISSGVNTYHVYSSTSSTYRFYVNENGGISNFSGNNVNLSDEREKKNISDLDSTWDCLKHWELKKFHYNEDEDAESLRYGVIAQQVAEYCPEVIADWVKQSAEPAKLDDDGNEIEPAKEEIVRMGVKDQQMMWMAIKAIQEAQLRIEALEAEVAALKAP